MNWFGKRSVVGVRALWAALPLAAGACSSSSSALPYTPYTGVDIQASTVLTGIGCGEENEQVVRYLVVLGDPNADGGSPDLSPLPDGGPPVWASVFSCFTNGAFASVTTSPRGSATVEAWIYAYDETDLHDAQTVVGEPLACLDPTCPLTVAEVGSILQVPSTYTTRCTATPESGDHVLTACGPLQSTRVAAGADAGIGD